MLLTKKLNLCELNQNMTHGYRSSFCHFDNFCDYGLIKLLYECFHIISHSYRNIIDPTPISGINGDATAQ